jgi:hypothetical protein
VRDIQFEGHRFAPHLTLSWAMPWIRRLVVGFSQRTPGFSPRLVHVGFVVDKVGLEQVFLQVRQMSRQ